MHGQREDADHSQELIPMMEIFDVKSDAPNAVPVLSSISETIILPRVLTKPVIPTKDSQTATGGSSDSSENEEDDNLFSEVPGRTSPIHVQLPALPVNGLIPGLELAVCVNNPELPSLIPSSPANYRLSPKLPSQSPRHSPVSSIFPHLKSKPILFEVGDPNTQPNPLVPQDPAPSPRTQDAQPAAADPTLQALEESSDIPQPPKKKHKDELVYSAITIGEKIGEGTFGTVSKGLLWGQEIAIKFLNNKKSTDEKDVKSFKQEVKIMRSLRHPNIVEFLGVVTDTEGNLCIVTEFLGRGSLEGILAKKRSLNKKIKFHTVLKYSLDIARGLTWLHAKGIIHRDLKPANILVDKNGRAKICDFGLSHVQKRQGNVGFYGVCGTPCYMAPEVLKKSAYGTAADIFSFGVIVCEILAGKYPYGNDPESTATFEQAITQGRRPEIVDCAHPKLKTLIEFCWNETPELRPDGELIIAKLTEIETEFANHTLPDIEPEDLPEDVHKFVEIERHKSMVREKNIGEKNSNLENEKKQQELVIHEQTLMLRKREQEIQEIEGKNKKLQGQLHQLSKELEDLQQQQIEPPLTIQHQTWPAELRRSTRASLKKQRNSEFRDSNMDVDEAGPSFDSFVETSTRRPCLKRLKSGKSEERHFVEVNETFDQALEQNQSRIEKIDSTDLASGRSSPMSGSEAVFTVDVCWGI